MTNDDQPVLAKATEEMDGNGGDDEVVGDVATAGGAAAAAAADSADEVGTAMTMVAAVPPVQEPKQEEEVLATPDADPEVDRHQEEKEQEISASGGDEVESPAEEAPEARGAAATATDVPDIVDETPTVPTTPTTPTNSSSYAMSKIAGLSKELTPAPTVDFEEQQEGGGDDGNVGVRGSNDGSGNGNVDDPVVAAALGVEDADADPHPNIVNNNSSSSTNSGNTKSFFIQRFSKWRKTVVEPQLQTWRSNGNAAATAATATTKQQQPSIPDLFKAQPITHATLSPASLNQEDKKHHEDDNQDGGDRDNDIDRTSGDGDESLSPSSSSSSGSSYSDGTGTYTTGSSCGTDNNKAAAAAPTSSSKGSNAGGSTVSAKVAALQWAAATVVDSVQQGYFRGRYQYNAQQVWNGSGGTPNNKANDDDDGENAATATAPVDSTPGPTVAAAAASASMSTPVRSQRPSLSINTGAQPSHTMRIMQSPHSSHVQQLMQGLQSHEFIMLLGKGMLGVNLKQAYLKESGVFVDFLVSRGAADQSKIIHAGDQLLMVGELDVRRGTIQQVPQQIAIAKRPVRLIWATGCLPGVNHLDAIHVAVAYMHEVHEQAHAAAQAAARLAQQQQQQQDLVSRTNNAEVDISLHHDEKKSDSEDDDADDDSVEAASIERVDSADSTQAETGADEAAAVIDGQVEEAPAVVRPISVEIPLQDTLDEFCNPGLPPFPVRQAYHPHAAKRNNERFSLSLLSRHLSDANFRNALRNAFILCAADGRRFPFLARNLTHQEDSLDEHDSQSSTTPNALLMLYIEMLNYADLYGVTPPLRRRQIAQRIAHKFFLPTKLGHELVPPMFDFHTMVADSSLRKLEAGLSLEEVPRDLFWDFTVAASDVLSGDVFLNFLVSADCARMRAYLRSTAPFWNVPIHEVFESVTTLSATPNHSARNYFGYLLAYLLCQTDKEGYGEHDDLLGAGGTRVEHAASSVCAAIYIRGKVLPAVRNAQDSSEHGAQLIPILEQLWEAFVAPYVGALGAASLPLSNEAEDHLKMLRSTMESIRCSSGQVDEVVKKIADSPFVEQATVLADELVYGYAANVHPKFREHKFHEWLCHEFSKARDDGSDEDTVSSPENYSVPRLPQGCVKRLLRKAAFPPGVAPHKHCHARKSTRSRSSMLMESSASESKGLEGLLNADCAVVFGTTVGLDLATQIPSPSMDDYDIRRYACLSLANVDDGLVPDEVPPTLESYAVAPPVPARPFAKYHDSEWTR